MSANPKLVKAYRHAVSKSPFCTAVTITLMSFASDTSDGKLYHGLYKANEKLFGKPLLIILPHYPHPKTGLPCLRWAVRIIDRNAQELWTGLFDPETETWDMWELKLYHRTSLGRAVRGEKPRKFTNRPSLSNLRVRLDSNGHGCSVIQLQKNHIIGYAGVDGGDLKYTLLMHGGFNEQRLEPGVVMRRWGVLEDERLRKAVWWQNHNYGSDELNLHRPMTWGWMDYTLIGKDAFEQRLRAIQHGANTGAMLMWGTEVAHPHLLPKFSPRHGLRSNIHTTPWDEAVYLVGREEKVAKVSKRKEDDYRMLIEKLNTVATFAKRGKRASGAMLGMIQRLLGGVTTEQLNVLFQKYCVSAHYNEKLSRYINNEIDARNARPAYKHEAKPGSIEAMILGGLS